MKKYWFKYIAALSTAIWLISASLISNAADDKLSADVPADLAKKITDQLKLARPDFEFSKVHYAPIEGLYQVKVIGGPELFVSADAKLIIAGDMYAVVNNSIRPYEHPALAKDRMAAISKVDIKDMIVFPAKGETKAYVNVFTDTTCGYCRKLHKEIAAINALGIEVRYLAYPREGKDSVGYRQLVTTWCSKDRQDTLTRFKNGESLPINECADNPVAQEYQLGEEIGVNATPTLILADGSLLPGYVPAAELAKILGIKKPQ